ncbi:MAG: AAA family ATPase [Akkermansiaceae bacterium]|nr:AAA family ATPase [Akkermansiaceae bacterium]
MKLLSIRLHPFGGTANRTCTLQDGINVLEGPNEFGKSTLSNALWHALFTPTNLPPKTLLKTIGRWYPKPGGDHARVRLEFEANGHKWILKKTWGAGALASLQADGAAGIADPSKVQELLCTQLRRNEATWRQVLFTSQAQLARTIDELKSKSGEIDEVQTLLAGAAAIPGDIPANKLISAMEDDISAHFGQWDQNTDGPKDGRGIDREWKQKVGPQLQAYYAMEKVRRDLKKVWDYENELDGINSKIKNLSEQMDDDEEFVVKGSGLRHGLTRRASLEQIGGGLPVELDLLMNVLTEWPGTPKAIQEKESEVTKIGEYLESLGKELVHAQKRAQAEQLRQGYVRLTKAKEEWNTAAQNLSKSKSLETGLLSELKELEPGIENLRIELEARTLTAKLESGASLSVRIQRGVEEAETLAISPSAAWEGQADGRFYLELEDLKLSVESGDGDMSDLFANLESARKRHTEILRIVNHDSLAAAEHAQKRHKDCILEESKKQDRYKDALQERTEEQWEADMAELAALPETRSVVVLEAERLKLIGERVKVEHEIGQLKDKVALWTKDHTDTNTLTKKILEKTAELEEVEKDLADLPTLPEGFSSIADYLCQLDRRVEARAEIGKDLNQLKIDHAQLTVAAPEFTAEELRADLEIKQREFERQQATGQSLLRIQSKLQAVIADRGINDPMQGLAAAVSSHFNKLTAGRYQEVTLDGSTPVSVSGSLSLGTSLLSQGTLGSLALATRLALSELYLKDMNGFFLLDDPFTDMDTTRRAAAVQAIGDFSKNHQVLFFTCHPDHAGELEELPGASNLLMTE